MVVVRRRRGDIVVFMLDHLLVSIAFVDFVGVPMDVIVVGGTVVICLTIPLLRVTQFTFLVCKWGPFFSFSLSLSFDGDLEADSFLGDDMPLGLFCCCWATIAKICSSKNVSQEYARLTEIYIFSLNPMATSVLGLRPGSPIVAWEHCLWANKPILGQQTY